MQINFPSVYGMIIFKIVAEFISRFVSEVACNWRFCNVYLSHE